MYKRQTKQELLLKDFADLLMIIDSINLRGEDEDRTGGNFFRLNKAEEIKFIKQVIKEKWSKLRTSERTIWMNRLPNLSEIVDIND